MNTPGSGAPGGGGLGALLDFSFKTFITLSVIKVLYILGMLVIALECLVLLIAGFSMGVGPGIGALIVVPIVALVGVIFLRVYLELICVIFRIGENTTALVERGRM
jgi:hypothetical protein